jgi:RND family efflux transporter MFP subunit
MMINRAAGTTEMAVSGPISRLAVAVLGVALLAALAWQRRQLVDARTEAGRSGISRAASSAVVPQGTRLTGGRIRAEGRVATYPGGQVTVGSEVGGRIVRLNVHEKQSVQRGALIAELDDTELRAAYAEARARIGEAEADLVLFEADLARLGPLAESSVISRQALDRTRHDRDAAAARREVARASLQRLDAAIAKTRIVAPISGQVITRFTNSGETLAPGAPIVTIADLRRVRVEAEVDEFDAHRLSLGDRVTVTAEGSGLTLQGRVEEIPDAVITRRLNPQDPSRPTDVRVLIAKIALDAQTTLKLGQRVEVVIEASAAPSPTATVPRD